MGAVFEVCLISNCDNEADLRLRYGEMQSSLRWEKGNDSYAGHLGIKPSGLSIRFKTLTPEDDVQVWFGDNDKWEKAWAYPCIDRDGKKGYLVGGWCSS